MVSGLPGLALAADVHDIHSRRGVVGTLPCSDCHTGSKHNSFLQSGGSGTIEVPEATGANAVLDFFSLNGSADGDGAYDPVAKTCANVDCHFGSGGSGTTSSVQNTNVALKCGTCHPAAADVDNFSYGDGIMAKISSTQWDLSGHGASTPYASGNAGANLAGPASDPEGCAYCHDFTVLHGDAANPFRLVNNNTLNHGWNDVCLVCHSTGDGGYDPDGSDSGYSLRGHSAGNEGKTADAAHFGGSHVNPGDGGKFCWDCHDPHGDRSGTTGNIYMVQSEVSLATDGAFGIPAVSGAVNLTRTTVGDLATPGSYVESTNIPATGVCQACHTDAGGFPGEVKYWRNNQTEDVDSNNVSENTPVASRHNSAGVCTSCHPHDSGFKPAGCSGCHGGGTIGSPTTVKNYWPDGSTARAENSPAQNRHLAHVEQLAARLFGETVTQLLTDSSGSAGGGALSSDMKQKRVCAYCHEDPAGANFMSGANLHNNGTANVTTPSVFIRRAWQPYATEFATEDTDASYDRAADTCAAVDCHNNTLTADGVYGWYDAGTSSCLLCHTPGGAGSDPVSGLHAGTPTVTGVAHDDQFGPNNATCTYCHASMPARGMTSTHVNGSFDANGMVAGNRAAMGLFADYTAVSMANNGTGTCAGGTGAGQVGAPGCHDAGDGGTWRREWDSANAYNTLASLAPCKGCHGAAAADFTFGTGHDAADGQTEHTFNWDGDANGGEVMAAGTHDGCKVCHGVNSPGDAHAAYVVGASFWRGRDGTSLHGDGSVQLNGPAPAAGTGYDQATWGCANAPACHPNDWGGGTYPTGAGHRLDDSNWPVSAVNFGGASCTSCHGYPPTGASDGGANWNLHATGTQGVKHDSIGSGSTAALKGNHGECGTCHGVRASATLDGFVVQDPAALKGSYTYAPAADHRDGSVTMNGNGNGTATDDAGYDPATGGCANAACHGNDSGHRIVPVSGAMPTASGVRLRDFGPGGCSNCHGGGLAGEGNLNAWPDGQAANGGNVYENRAGAHQKHVDAIYAQNAASLAGASPTEKKNSTCAWCHPTGRHTGDQSSAPADVMNGTTAFFRNMSGATDPDGAFVPAGASGNGTCVKVDCHGGTTTFAWSFATDGLPPSWAAGSGIAATDKGWGGVLEVSWAAASDAFPSDPVTYDLYLSTTNSAAAVFGGPAILTDIAGTSALVTGLLNGTTYYFGVRAKDSWVVPNVTANSDVSLGKAPSGTPAGPQAKTYVLTRRNSGTIYGTTAFNGGACGTAATAAAANATPATIPYVWRGGLESAVVCGAASANNYVSNSSPNSGGGTTFENMLAFYTPTTYPAATAVAGAATGTSLWMRGSGGTEDVRLWLASSDPTTGALTLSAQSVTLADIGTTLVAKTPDLSALSVTVAAGARLALLVTWADTSTTASTNDRIMVDNVSGQISQLAVTELVPDVTPPAWSPTAGLSGIAVLPRGDGSLSVSWSAATDSGSPSSPPVLYDVYRKINPDPVTTPCAAVAFDLWSAANLYLSGVSATSVSDSGVSLATKYCYGVMAKDSAATPNVRQATDAAFGEPVRGASVGCNSCHNSPPDAASNAGSHAAHANADSDYTECNTCHPGTTSYTNVHSDGVGQLAFDGSAVGGSYGAGLTYTDNAIAIYSDTNGYGILTGSAGDGVDNGTCARGATSSTLCHGGGSVDPTWGGTLPGGCGACHNATGKGASAAPTVTSASPHVDADGAAAAWAGGDCKGCHAGHGKGVRVPLPPSSWSDPSGRLSGANMQARLGIAYTTYGGIDLGGPGTAASISGRSTEAEICWGCHDSLAPAVSEWGYNTKTTAAGFPNKQLTTKNDGTAESFNHGWLYTDAAGSTKTSDWTAGYWRSQYYYGAGTAADPGLRLRVRSVHSTNFETAGQKSSVGSNVDASGVLAANPTLEVKGELRCSYCHDVHDTFGQNGKPYLRGTWVGNPYPPDMPPADPATRTGDGFAAYPTSGGPTSAGQRWNTTQTAGMPRLWADTSLMQKGGHFVDANSGNPTANAAMDTLAETAGLCDLCHKAATAADVDTLDFYTGQKLWLSTQTNGHANAALGGDGAGKANLFAGRRGAYPTPGGSPSTATGMDQGDAIGVSNWGVGGPNAKSNDIGGWRNVFSGPQPCNGNGANCPPRTSGYYGTANQTTKSGDHTNWYSTTGVGSRTGTAGGKAHDFTCSKCHSPHAAGLPALLITNCLDKTIANWSANTGRVGPNATAGNAQSFQYANNCHRKTSASDGWNRLAPAQNNK